jgi:hypothetical protein
MLHEPSEKGRLAGPDLPSQDDKAPTLANPVEETSIGFLISRIRVEKARVRGYTKW